MSTFDKQELELLGYKQVYDYVQYSHDNHVNVIPEESFKRLVSDTFKTIADVLRKTYGPYGSTVIITDQNVTTTTKDGYNVFEAMGFSHHYKRMVYLAIKKIIERVNRNVGDGTTSCILLAEKMFENLNKLIKTPDDSRNTLHILSIIEKDLQNMDHIHNDRKEGFIKCLDKESLRNIINLAGNYDEELTKVIYEALCPKYNSSDKSISSVRNIVIESEVDYSGESNVCYAIDYLPGDYRIRVDMDVELGLSFVDKTDIKIVLYDHAFGPADWNNFIQKYDKETKVLIIARTFTKTFMDNEYLRYLKERAFVKAPINIILSAIAGSNIQNELKDLAALLKTEVRDLHAGPVDHENIPTATIQMYKGNALCFYNVEKPEEYINKLYMEMKKDLSHSYITQKSFMDRIKALSLESQDTLITVKAGTSLELKMITDKIDDCVSIVNSALSTGIVPNMLAYAYYRMNNISLQAFSKDEQLLCDVAGSIMTSIGNLFNIVWGSKYENSDKDSKECEAIKDNLYIIKRNSSYDIISDSFVDVTTLPTSAQYDLEVVVASISIVKYLLTSRALVFDAHLMTPVDDQGHFQKY